MPLPLRPLVPLLLWPVARALNATAEDPGASWRPHLLQLHAAGVRDRLRPRTACPTWCRVSQVHWDRKCKWEKCRSSGCWDCQWSESAKAYNYELQTRLRAEGRATWQASQKELDRKQEEDQDRKMAKTRLKLGRQREAELEQEKLEPAADLKLTTDSLRRASAWALAPTGGSNLSDDSEDVEGDD